MEIDTCRQYHDRQAGLRPDMDLSVPGKKVTGIQAEMRFYPENVVGREKLVQVPAAFIKAGDSGIAVESKPFVD